MSLISNISDHRFVLNIFKNYTSFERLELDKTLEIPTKCYQFVYLFQKSSLLSWVFDCFVDHLLSLIIDYTSA